MLVQRPEWGDLFESAGVDGTFVLHEIGTGETSVYDLERAEDPRIPASTFKILNSMIILETGVLPDTETVVVWDGVDRTIPDWNKDHTLRTAIEVSAVWVFQALAREVGSEQMADWVERAGFGNADIGGGIDQFWLDGDLRISPLGQVAFLTRLLSGELPFSAEVTDAVREILVRESGAGWTYSYKTGNALSEEPDLGWLVGIVENQGREWVFALNVDLVAPEGQDFIDPQVRQDLGRAILEGEGLLPA